MSFTLPYDLMDYAKGRCLVNADRSKQMPAEIRHLVFRHSETVDAVREYRRRIGRPLPSGRLRRFYLRALASGRSDFSAVFEILPRGSAHCQSVEVDQSDLKSALILFCSDNRIPLPRQAAKELEGHGNHLTLVVTVRPRSNEDVVRETI